MKQHFWLDDRFAEVEHFQIASDSKSGHAVVGYAAPKRGIRPCGVALLSNDELLAIQIAGNYSSDAHADGVRHGWCGFEIGDLRICALLDRSIDLRCAKTGRMLRSWSAIELRELKPPEPTPITLADYLGQIRKVGTCDDVAQAGPFGESHRAECGDYSFIEATYQWIFERTPALDEVKYWMANLPAGWTVVNCWTSLMKSDEARAKGGLFLVGPFDAGFPFILAPLQP